MRSDLLWIVVLIMTRASAHPLPAPEQSSEYAQPDRPQPQPQSQPQPQPQPQPNPQPPASDSVHREEGEVISVRITSSVAVDRGHSPHTPPPPHAAASDSQVPVAVNTAETTDSAAPHLPRELQGANVEFLKQLNAKKEARALHGVERAHPFQSSSLKPLEESEDSAIEESVKSILEIPLNNNEDLYRDVPLARSVPSRGSGNYVRALPEHPNERRNSPRLTTVSFNIVHHSTPIVTPNYNDEVNAYTGDQSKSFSTPEHFYSEPPKVYSQPAKVYSEPAKVYSEPAKIYSEPAKVYSEPAKVYGEPAKIYSEPAKFYSQPASLHLELNGPPAAPHDTTVDPSTISTTLSTTQAPQLNTSTERADHQHEKNYEVDEKVSLMTDGRSHGVQEPSPGAENCKQDNCKVGYVVEGRQYRKYRVEERTPDGFIVGEYGVVRNEDGALRGVRYTADSDATPRLIYDALIKFLQLK